MARPRKHVIAFSDDEVQAIKSKLKSKSTNNTIRGRIEVLLLFDTNHSGIFPYEVVGKKSGTSLSTVRKVVKLYSVEGLEGMLNLKRNPNSDTLKTKMD